MHELDLEPVWDKYGLKGSPYFTEPLRLIGPIPIEKAFANREKELTLLGKSIRSTRSTRTLIIGDPGIGKTTFGNYLRWILCRKDAENSKYLTIPIELKIQQNWDNVQFLRSCLAAIHNASIVFNWTSLKIKLNTLKDIESYVKVSKAKSGSVGVNLLGNGGNVGYGSTLVMPPSVPAEILEDFYLRVLKEIRDHGRQLIIQFNNLENMETVQLAQLMKSVRDYLQIEGLHTFFLGPPDALSAFEMYNQVQSVFGKPIILEPLTMEQVLDILKKRCESLKAENGKYITPYQEETVKILYEHLNGNIRLIFKVLNDVTQSSADKAPCSITIDDIRSYSTNESERKLHKLNRSQKKILFCLHDKKELNHGSLSKATNIASSNLSKYVKALKEKGLVVARPDPSDGRATLYRLSESTQLMMRFSVTKKNK